MKRTFFLLVPALIFISFARAGEVKVEAYMATGPSGDEKTTFTSDTEKIYTVFKTQGAKNGDKIRGALIAEDVGDVAPANTKVLETKLDMEGDTDDGDFNFSKPTNGWPTGKYRVEIYVNDELATKVKFTIKAAKVNKSKDEDEESGD